MGAANFFLLVISDGWHLTTLKEFLRDNREGLAAEAKILRDLRPGDMYHGGGGAGPHGRSFAFTAASCREG